LHAALILNEVGWDAGIGQCINMGSGLAIGDPRGDGDGGRLVRGSGGRGVFHRDRDGLHLCGMRKYVLCGVIRGDVGESHVKSFARTQLALVVTEMQNAFIWLGPLLAAVGRRVVELEEIA